MLNLKDLKNKLNDDLDNVLEILKIDTASLNAHKFSFCPVHDESDNPKAFSMSARSKRWKCWTRGCHEEYGDDIFGLIKGIISKRESKNATFTDVLSWIRMNIPQFIDNALKKDENAVVVVADPLQEVINKFYKENTRRTSNFESPGFQSSVPSLYFVNDRHFKKETMIEFGVGDSQETSALMRNRAIIPIHNDDGSSIVGHICRANKDYIEPKFYIEKNFNKNEWFYNFHRAKAVAEQKSAMFLVEGQGDVWRLWEAGVKNAVGLFGKEVFDSHIDKLNSIGVTTLVILLDHDQPGREAKTKIKRKLDRYFKLFFPELKTRKDVGAMSPEAIHKDILIKLKGLY